MSKINLNECRYEQACIGNGEVEVTYYIDDVVVGVEVVANGTTEGETMGDVHSKNQYYYDTDELIIKAWFDENWAKDMFSNYWKNNHSVYISNDNQFCRVVDYNGYRQWQGRVADIPIKYKR